jgi:uncharacterized protein HemY
MTYLELASYILATIAAFLLVILFVLYVIMPFLAWVVRKVLGE